MLREVSRPGSKRETLILDAAKRRFAVYGLSKVTMDEVAGDVGMGKASLYYYFPTKEELFRGVIQREQERLIASLDELRARDISAGRKLRQYVERRIRYSSELLNLRSLGPPAWLSSRPPLLDLVESLAAKELSLLTELLRAGKQSGEFVVRSPKKTARLILHVLQGLRWRTAQWALVQERPAEVSEEIAGEMRFLIELIVRGLSKTNSR
jgi:TetR/AcrR family transcriptional regulator